MLHPEEYMEHYEEEVILLTGATGNLGSCLLFKLALQLPTKKIFLLCRGSVADAIEKWEQLMPEQIDEILDSQKVHILISDMRRPGLGLKKSELDMIGNEVTTIIHTAANISLVQGFQDSVRDNCVPVSVLLDTASKFRSLRFLVHISTASVAFFQSARQVEERLYALDDNSQSANEELGSILFSDSPLSDSRFPWPYAQAKHLAERLVLENEFQIPALIIRPTMVGPAIKDPYPLYGSDGAIPTHGLPQIFLSMDNLQREKLVTQPWASNNVADEIPVDVVANSCLLHVASRTTGIVHSSCELYVRLSLHETMDVFQKCVTKEQVEELLKIGRRSYHPLAFQLYDLATTDHQSYRFICKRSEHQKLVTGPLSLWPPDHDPAEHFGKRVQLIAQRAIKSLGVSVKVPDPATLKTEVRRVLDAN